MHSDDIVEVYVAASEVEAYAQCDRLRQEGIDARVVGEWLGNVAGGVPLGSPTAPRIWVRKADAQRAREILAARPAEAAQPADEEPPAEPPPGDETAPAAAGAAAAAYSDPSQTARSITALLSIAAVACFVGGSFWTARNWRERSVFSQTAQATLTKCRVGGVDYESFPPGDPNLPIPFQDRLGGRIVPIFDAVYVYTVEERQHKFHVETREMPPRTRRICYNPDEPSEMLVDPPTPPWLILTVACGLGLMLAVVAYQFR